MNRVNGKKISQMIVNPIIPDDARFTFVSERTNYQIKKDKLLLGLSSSLAVKVIDSQGVAHYLPLAVI